MHVCRLKKERFIADKLNAKEERTYSPEKICNKEIAKRKEKSKSSPFPHARLIKRDVQLCSNQPTQKRETGK
jgi:tRNA-dihydrouridine synthase